VNIRFVNHASFVCERNGISLICDPWLYGSAFNDGWDLIEPSQLAAKDLVGINYIWFSHEHPDHFSPRVLLDIPKEAREKITILYKETTDRKVLGFCRKQGFRTKELIDDERFELGGGLAVRCCRVPLHDSWLFIESPEFSVLNLNDAVVENSRALKTLASKFAGIDVLFTQFNYAAWRGNIGDSEIRRRDAAKKLATMTQQIQGLQPRFTVPFASFSFFSHKENFFTNDQANTVKDALGAIKTTRSTPIVMFPGDVWSVGSSWDNSGALTRYEKAYASLPGRPLRESLPVPFEQLVLSASICIERVRSANDKWMLELLKLNPFFPCLRPLEIYLSDLDMNVRFSFEHGLKRISWRPGRYDLRMGSDSLNFLLKHAWGIDTLTVNGRFAADPAGLKRLIGTFGVDALNNAGIRLTPAFAFELSTLAFFARIMSRKLWSLRTRPNSQDS